MDSIRQSIDLTNKLISMGHSVCVKCNLLWSQCVPKYPESQIQLASPFSATMHWPLLQLKFSQIAMNYNISKFIHTSGDNLLMINGYKWCICNDWYLVPRQDIYHHSSIFHQSLDSFLGHLGMDIYLISLFHLYKVGILTLSHLHLYHYLTLNKMVSFHHKSLHKICHISRSRHHRPFRLSMLDYKYLKITMLSIFD